jgi:hypothetical protein
VEQHIWPRTVVSVNKHYFKNPTKCVGLVQSGNLGIPVSIFCIHFVLQSLLKFVMSHFCIVLYRLAHQYRDAWRVCTLYSLMLTIWSVNKGVFTWANSSFQFAANLTSAPVFHTQILTSLKHLFNSLPIIDETWLTTCLDCQIGTWNSCTRKICSGFEGTIWSCKCTFTVQCFFWFLPPVKTDNHDITEWHYWQHLQSLNRNPMFHHIRKYTRNHPKTFLMEASKRRFLKNNYRSIPCHLLRSLMPTAWNKMHVTWT